MNKVYFLLGSNMNNPVKQLTKAKSLLIKQIGNIVRESSIYETAAWGNPNQPNFLNQVIIINSNLSAQKTMQTILKIEEKMGRVRTKKNAPRIIDIDILFFNKDIVAEPNLIVPHPLLQQRRFVITPLNELSPNFKHPILKKTIHQLLQLCTDKLDVKKF